MDEVKKLVDQLAYERPDKSPDPVLVEEGYKGFNLVRYGDKIYAIPQRDGAFQIERILNNKYSQWFSGNSLRNLESLWMHMARKDSVSPVALSGWKSCWWLH